MQVRQGDTATVMREMKLDGGAIERRKKFVGLTHEDAARIAGVRDLVVRNVDDFARAFFDFLEGLDEARGLLASRELSERARALKRQHLLAMVGGEYGVAYVEQRLDLGLLYSRVKIEPQVFLGGFHHLLKQIGIAIVGQSPNGPIAGFESFMSLKKIGFFDIGLIVDVLIYERERLIRQQQEAIRELSTPVLQIRDRLLLLPLIGVIDTLRARQLTESLLHAIRATRAKVTVMDVTGVATIDSKVANHLLQTVAAARLMGTRVIVTGVTAEVAQSLVALGINLAQLSTAGDLQGGMEEAEHLLGYRVGAAPTAAGP